MEKSAKEFPILYNMILWLKLSRCSFQLRTLSQEAPYLGTAVNLEHQNQPEVSYQTLEIGMASGHMETPDRCSPSGGSWIQSHAKDVVRTSQK